MKINYTKELNILYSADILVAGGGPAGFAAAVTAARQNKSTILIEQSGSIGGASVLSMVAELMNFDDGENFLSGGIGREIFDGLGLHCDFKREWYNIRCEDLKRLYDRIILESGVKVLFYTRITDVICEDGSVRYAIVSGPDGSYAIDAKMFIDCTGNGSLSAFAGAEYGYGDVQGNAMSATICSLWGGVDFDRKERDGKNYQKAYDDGIFSQYDSVLPGIKANYPEVGVGRGNVGHCFGVDDRSTESLTNAMFEGRKILSEYEKYYREYVAGCENAVIVSSADFIGIRESRRIICEYMLTKDDFFSKEPFYDEIGRYSYPVDIHPMTADKSGMDDFSKAISMRHGKGESYSIPYRSLVVKGLCNVLVAGRALGAEHEMQASARVIPCCYITGQAAGAAASVCIDNGTSAKDCDIAKLRDILLRAGAYLK